MRHHWPIILVLTLYLALAIGYSLATPPYEPSDELRHFRYVRHIAVYRRLPVQGADTPRAQSHHPPLYYALGALVSGWLPVEKDVYYGPPGNPFWGDRYWEVSNDNKNQYLHGQGHRFPFEPVIWALYLVRWMTVLAGAGVVLLTYHIGREILPDRPTLAVGAAGLVAFTPQFIHMSSSVINDVPAALCGAAVLLASVRIVRHGPSLRADITLGALYGLALLTKLNLLALIGLIGLAYLLAAWQARSWRPLLRGPLIVVAVAALISGWWFWRNQRLYGDPTGMRMVNELWAGRDPSKSWWALRQGLPHLWSSLWGRFGYGQLPLPKSIYRGLLSFCGFGLLGYVIPRKRRTLGRSALLLVASMAIFIVVVGYYILIQPAGAMGRFLFPAMPAFAVLLVGGWGRYTPQRSTGLVGGLAAAGMALLAFYALLGVLAPAFAAPRPLSDAQIATIPHPTNLTFGLSGEDVARLRGYQVGQTSVEPGDTLQVTLYWETLVRAPQNDLVFVHLLSDAGTMVAQRDTHPGLGNYPTSAWQPGVVFADTYRVPIPETAYTPDGGTIQVGMYVPDGPRLVTSDGRDAVKLARFRIESRPSRFPNPVEANFGDRIRLGGYTMAPRTVSPGETITLTLYWEALAPMEANYGVFAHVLGEVDQVWGWNDSWPVDGKSPTSLWKPGEVITDVRPLPMGQTTPPDFYDVEIGLAGPAGKRLPVLAEDGHQLGDRVLLSPVRVLKDE